MNLRLTAAVEGNLKKFLASELKAAKTGVTAGIRRATEGAKAELRRKVISAGLGRRLANTWRSQVYPKGNQSLNAAGYIASKAQKLARVFTKGATIRAKNKKFIAIPTESAPIKRGKKNSSTRHIEPSEWTSEMGELRLIKRKGKPGLLVSEQVARKSKGGFKFKQATEKQKQRGKRLVTVVMYILVKQATIRKKYDLKSISKKWGKATPALILDSWPKVLANGERADSRQRARLLSRQRRAR